MRTKILPAAAVTLVLGASTLQAHHSGYVYQREPSWISGTVTAFERLDPHTLIRLEERRDDGTVRRWSVEGPGRSQLARQDVRLPQAGETLVVCIFPYKPAEELARIFPEVVGARAAEPDADAPQLVAGHVLVRADGSKQFWEPHGVLSACIRGSGDDRQSWLDFLASNQRALDAWCEQATHEHVRSTPALQEIVTEINAQIRAALERRC